MHSAYLHSSFPSSGDEAGTFQGVIKPVHDTKDIVEQLYWGSNDSQQVGSTIWSIFQIWVDLLCDDIGYFEGCPPRIHFQEEGLDVGSGRKSLNIWI